MALQAGLRGGATHAPRVLPDGHRMKNDAKRYHAKLALATSDNPIIVSSESDKVNSKPWNVKRVALDENYVTNPVTDEEIGNDCLVLVQTNC